MTSELTVGDRAPDFDLASTENVVIMLRDEVPRSRMLLYLFNEASAAQEALGCLARRAADLADKGIKILGISETALDELVALQRDARLPFPLLHDDRGLSSAYGAGSGTPPVVVLVERDQHVAWIDRGDADVDAALDALVASPVARERSTSGYPASVINRLVDRWVN